MNATREYIDRQKEGLEFITRETQKYEEKIADMFKKIEVLEEELLSSTSQGRQIPALVRENIGISVEAQFLEYERNMRQNLNASTAELEPARLRPSNPVTLDTSQYPYAEVVPPQQPMFHPAHPSHLTHSVSHPPPYPTEPAVSALSNDNSPNRLQHLLSPIPTSHNMGTGTPNHSPSTPTNILFQNSPDTMVSTSGQIYSITHVGSLNQVMVQPISGHPSPVPVPERPNRLPIPPRPSVPGRPAPPPPSLQLPSCSGASSSQDGDDGKKWACPSCSYENHSALIYCEMCENCRTAPRIGAESHHIS